MAYTSTEVDELRAALATGALSVTHSGPTGSKSVTFQSREAMLAQLALMEQELGIVTRRRRLHVVGFR